MSSKWPEVPLTILVTSLCLVVPHEWGPGLRGPKVRGLRGPHGTFWPLGVRVQDGAGAAAHLCSMHRADWTRPGPSTESQKPQRHEQRTHVHACVAPSCVEVLCSHVPVCDQSCAHVTLYTRAHWHGGGTVSSLNPTTAH